jgi:hypothetical protein
VFNTRLYLKNILRLSRGGNRRFPNQKKYSPKYIAATSIHCKRQDKENSFGALSSKLRQTNPRGLSLRLAAPSLHSIPARRMYRNSKKLLIVPLKMLGADQTIFKGCFCEKLQIHRGISWTQRVNTWTLPGTTILRRIQTVFLPVHAVPCSGISLTHWSTIVPQRIQIVFLCVKTVLLRATVWTPLCTIGSRWIQTVLVCVQPESPHVTLWTPPAIIGSRWFQTVFLGVQTVSPRGTLWTRPITIVTPWIQTFFLCN